MAELGDEMIECACACDGDSEGIFSRYTEIHSREYHTCSECGDAIWPWQRHTVGMWWDCGCCDRSDDDCGMDDGCERDLEPDSEDHMCQTCTRACDQLLCGCWWVGQVWEKIAQRNEMLLSECLGGVKEHPNG